MIPTIFSRWVQDPSLTISISFTLKVDMPFAVRRGDLILDPSEVSGAVIAICVAYDIVHSVMRVTLDNRVIDKDSKQEVIDSYEAAGWTRKE